MRARCPNIIHTAERAGNLLAIIFPAAAACIKAKCIAALFEALALYVPFVIKKALVKGFGSFFMVPSSFSSNKAPTFSMLSE
jgi:hypothetical protein